MQGVGVHIQLNHEHHSLNFLIFTANLCNEKQTNQAIGGSCRHAGDFSLSGSSVWVLFLLGMEASAEGVSVDNKISLGLIPHTPLTLILI